VLLERLRNETTRLTAVMAWGTLAGSPLVPGLGAALEPLIAELTSFLRKANRRLRQTALTTTEVMLSAGAAVSKDQSCADATLHDDALLSWSTGHQACVTHTCLSHWQECSSHRQTLFPHAGGGSQVWRRDRPCGAGSNSARGGAADLRHRPHGHRAELAPGGAGPAAAAGRRTRGRKAGAAWCSAPAVSGMHRSKGGTACVGRDPAMHPASSAEAHPVHAGAAGEHGPGDQAAPLEALQAFLVALVACKPAKTPFKALLEQLLEAGKQAVSGAPADMH
jgi:hypothetical protein